MLTICRTRGGIYATQTDVRATSVELWLKALGASPSLISLHSKFSDADVVTDLLFERLQNRFDLSNIKAISVLLRYVYLAIDKRSPLIDFFLQPAPVWLTKDAPSILKNLYS
jgi:hypothetical protein